MYPICSNRTRGERDFSISSALRSRVFMNSDGWSENLCPPIRAGIGTGLVPVTWPWALSPRRAHFPAHLAPAVARHGDLDHRLAVLDPRTAQAAHLPFGRRSEYQAQGDRGGIGVAEHGPHRLPAARLLLVVDVLLRDALAEALAAVGQLELEVLPLGMVAQTVLGDELLAVRGRFEHRQPAHRQRHAEAVGLV